MTCDVCDKVIDRENGDEYNAGRWVGYCNECKDNGKGPEKDQNLFWENECANGERLDGLDGEGEELLMSMF